MPQTAHSIVVSDVSLAQAEAVEKIWQAVRDCGAKSGRAYTLERYSPDGTEVQLVATRSDLAGPDLPRVTESANTYNMLTYSTWIDTMEILVLVDTRQAKARYSLVFMGDATKEPGAQWLARACEALVVGLRIDAVLLVASGADETETLLRTGSGVPLLTLVLKRMREESAFGPPLLAVIEESAVPPDIYQAATDAGLRVGAMPSGPMMFSAIHD